MGEEEFRKEILPEISRLLAYWKVIEFWIKRAEQVNGDAVIPAINELRYASRQLFNATTVLMQPAVSPSEMKHIRKRITIAEQYLLNAEHDICDAIIGVYQETIQRLDTEFGTTAITVYCPEYPFLKQTVDTCLELIAEARRHYEKRAENYKAIREIHFQPIYDYNKKLFAAEVAVKAEKARFDVEHVRLRARLKLFEWIALIASIVGIISLPVSIYLWTIAYPDFCKLHASSILNVVCETTPLPAANTPSTPG
jgi:hypothetical protein